MIALKDLVVIHQVLERKELKSRGKEQDANISGDFYV